MKFEHDVTFDGNRRRPTHADIVFTDEDGDTFHLTAAATHPDVNANYGMGMSRRQSSGGLSFYKWNSTDSTDLDEVEANAVSLDQLMQFEMDGMIGHGIFELLVRATITSDTQTGARRDQAAEGCPLRACYEWRLSAVSAEQSLCLTMHLAAIDYQRLSARTRPCRR